MGRREAEERRRWRWRRLVEREWQERWPQERHQPVRHRERPRERHGPAGAAAADPERRPEERQEGPEEKRGAERAAFLSLAVAFGGAEVERVEVEEAGAGGAGAERDVLRGAADARDVAGGGGAPEQRGAARRADLVALAALEAVHGGHVQLVHAVLVGGALRFQGQLLGRRRIHHEAAFDQHPGSCKPTIMFSAVVR